MPMTTKKDRKEALSEELRVDDDFAIVPGDLPLLTVNDYEGCLKEMSSDGISRAIHKGVPGHPVMFAKKHREGILSFPGSMKEYISMFRSGLYEAGCGCILDADTPSAYSEILLLHADRSILH